jgi:hypothetical protein
MCKAIRIISLIFFILVASNSWAQVFYLDSTVYFSPCLAIRNRKEIEIDFTFKAGVYRLSDSTVKAIELTSEFLTILEANHAEEDLEMHNYSGHINKNFVKETSESYFTRAGAFTCRVQVNAGIRMVHARNKYKTVDFKNYEVSIDTLVFDNIRIVLNESCETKGELNRIIEILSAIEIVEPDGFPSNTLRIADDSLYAQFVNLAFNTTFQVAHAPCITPQELHVQFPELYSPDLDSLVAQGELAQVNHKLQSRYFKKRMKDWTEQKAFLQEKYAGWGDLSSQREKILWKRLYDGQPNLNDYMNYMKGKNAPSFFDTLAMTHLTQRLLPRLIENELPSLNFANSFFRMDSDREHFIHYKNAFDSNYLYFNLKELLEEYLYFHYIKGYKRDFVRTKLLESPDCDVYSFESSNPDLDNRILVSVLNEGNGNWLVRLDTLRDEAYLAPLNSIGFWNELMMFNAGTDYLIIDTLDQKPGTTYIDIYPQVPHPFLCEIFVQENSEIYEWSFRDVRFCNALLDSLSADTTAGWDVSEPTYYSRFFAYLKPDDIVYYYNGLEDLNKDGITELFAYAISNGKPVYAQCYSTVSGLLVKLNDSSALSILGQSKLFSNLLIVSKIGKI